MIQTNSIGMSGSIKHTFANPGPAGLMVLAFYLGCLWPVATHQVPHELAVVLVPLGLAGGIVQLAAGIIELRNGMAMTGNILLAFSTFMFLGMGEHLMKVLSLMPADTAGVDGWVFLIMGILMCGFTIGHLPGPLAPLIFMITTDLFFVPAGLYFLTGMDIFWTIAGWDLPLVVLSIIWVVLGTILNPIFQKTIIPLGPSLIKIPLDEQEQDDMKFGV
jgi:succinate-acetate transporter protein